MIKEVNANYLHYLVEHEGFVLPGNSTPNQRKDGRGTAIFTESEWEAYKWNVYRHSGEVIDPNASPKPTWEKMVYAHRQGKIAEIAEKADGLLNTESDYDEFYTNKSPRYIRELISTEQDSDIHVHGGIDRMTGLVYLCEAADKSGESLPHVVMRNDDNEVLPIYIPSQIRPVLDELTKRKNTVESCHNTLVAKYKLLADVRDSKTADLDKKEKAANDAYEFVTNYETHLKAEMKAFDPHKAPSDLKTLKEWTIGHLEREANKHIKRIKNAVTQQGVDLPASCDDQENAIRELAAIKQLAQLNINALETAANVKAEYDKAVKKMADVTPLNTPIYLVPGNPTPLASPYAPSSAANRFTIRIRNPAGVEGIIETEITRTGNAAHKIEHIFLDTKFRFLLLTITPGTEASEFSVISRNLCGPGKPFVIEVPAKS